MRKDLEPESLPRSALYSYLGIIAVMAFSMLGKIILTRLLSPKEVGMLFTGQMIFGLGSFLGGLWLSDGAVYFISKNAREELGHAKGIFLLALKRGVLFSVVAGSGLMLFSQVIAEGIYENVHLTPILLIWAATIPFGVIAGITAAGFQGLGKMPIKVVCHNLIPVLLLLVSLGACFWINVKSLLLITCLYAAVPVYAAVLLIFKMVKSPFWMVKNQHDGSSKELLQYSYPLLASGLVAWPMAFIPLVLGAMLSTEELAYYNLSMSLALLIVIPVNALTPAVLPIWVNMISQSEGTRQLRDHYANITKWILILSSFIFVPLYFCSEQTASLLFGGNFSGLSSTLKLLAPVIFLTAAVGPMESLIKAQGQPKVILFARIIVGVVAGASVYPLIKYYGYNGSLMAYIASAIAGYGVYFGVMFHKYKIHPFRPAYNKTLLGVICAVAVIGLILPQVLPSYGALDIILYCASYLGILLFLLKILNAVSFAEVEFIKGKINLIVFSRSRK